jgi:hypothetical protein
VVEICITHKSDEKLYTNFVGKPERKDCLFDPVGRITLK